MCVQSITFAGIIINDMNRQDLFKTVPNYFGETVYGKCGAGFNARLGGGISIAKGETAAEILANAKKVLKSKKKKKK
jgi:hypothetical protein